MAENSSDGVTWYLTVPTRHKDVLGAIRHWDNLKIAIDGETVWVKDFTTSQVESVDIKILPFKQVYYSRGPKLFPYGSGLPHGNIPSLLWSPIERGLQVQLPSFNYNYFGVKGRADVSLVRSGHEIVPAAMMVTVDLLKKYLETAPVARLMQMQWVLIGDRALLKGTPLLPITGEVYWQKGLNFIPAGYDLDMPVLSEVFDTVLSDGGKSFILWDKSSTWTNVPLSSFRQLSLSSFRNTLIT